LGPKVIAKEEEFVTPAKLLFVICRSVAKPTSKLVRMK
jgi:hypothetical protein